MATETPFILNSGYRHSEKKKKIREFPVDSIKYKHILNVGYCFKFFLKSVNP